MAIDSADNLHVVWQDYTECLGSSSDMDIFYKLWDASSGSWNVIDVVSTESTNIAQLCSVTIDFTDSVHVAWQDLTDYSGSGADFDINYKKFVGPPTAPKYLIATPSFSTSGVITLNWAEVGRSNAYYLYRETTYITTISGIIPILRIEVNDYVDTLDANGTYFYAVIAENQFGNSTLSPVVDVQVDTSNLLSFISNESLIVAGILLCTQIIFFIIAISIRKSSGKKSKKK